MRKTLFFIACAITALSCKKEADSRYAHYYGKWELEGRASFWSSQSYPPGNGNFMVLGENGIYERISADTVRFREKYSLEEKKECMGEAKKIHFRTTDPAVYMYGEPTLTLYDNDYLMMNPPNCTADMNSYGYRRVK